MKQETRHAETNRILQSGAPFYMGREPWGFEFSSRYRPGYRLLRTPAIGIYAGKGASHSWLWFVDMFEKMGFLDLFFLDNRDLREKPLFYLDVLIISGGDTFAVADALGTEGAAHIKSFVENGGIYVGSCAGAYLPMNSSKTPLNLFNFVNVKITNLAKNLPETIQTNYKFCTSYGCGFIFHPVRETVKLKLNCSLNQDPHHEFNAPLYGGPGMIHDQEDNILAYYSDFTDQTSFLVNRKAAADTLIGKAAVIRIPFQKGCFYLFGPHLEHPHYPDANAFVGDAILWDSALTSCDGVYRDRDLSNDNHVLEPLNGKQAKDLINCLKRELSNSRIAASGLEFLPISWMIGKKRYDPEKIRVFLESLWKRIKPLEKKDSLTVYPGMISQLVFYAEQMTQQIRGIKKDVEQNKDTLEQAAHLFENLQQLSITFLGLFFQSIKQTGA